MLLARMEFAGPEILEFFLSPVPRILSPFQLSRMILSKKFVQVPIFILWREIIQREAASDTMMDYSVFE